MKLQEYYMLETKFLAYNIVEASFFGIFKIDSALMNAETFS